jgi:hypothetical protein
MSALLKRRLPVSEKSFRLSTYSNAIHLPAELKHDCCQYRDENHPQVDSNGARGRPHRLCQGNITSVQAVYVPADGMSDPAAGATLALDTRVNLSRNQQAAKGLYPAVDPLRPAATAWTGIFSA